MSTQNEKVRVLIDLDGVIRDFVKGLEIVYQREYPDHKIQEVISRDLDKYFPIGKQINDFIDTKFYQEILSNAPVYPGTIESLYKWEKFFKIVIVTSQPPKWRYPTYYWIGKHAVPTDEIHLSFEKYTIDGYALLDDFVDNLQAFASTGRLAVCFDQPWNKNWEGERVKGIDEFFQLVEKKLNT
jgi:hypothetical protein